MMPPEPSREWQAQQHQRLLHRDPTAFAELCERTLPYLVAFLRAQFPQQENHICEQVAIDFLLSYQAKPKQYNPAKLELLAYFRMAVRADMLNAIDKQKRQQQRLLDIDNPAIQQELVDPNEKLTGDLDEWLQQHTTYSRQEILAALDDELTAEDKAILLLMLDGERATTLYAQTMDITHLDEVSQRQEVKRAKDRLLKKLQRFGAQLRR